MPTYKLAFKFTQPQAGWDEIFYRTSATLAEACTFNDPFWDATMKMRDRLTVLQTVTATEVSNNRISLPVPKKLQGLNYTEGPDVAATSCVLKLSAPTIGTSRNLWCRGLPDEYVKRSGTSGVDTPSDPCYSAIYKYLNQMFLSGLQVQALTKIGTSPNLFTPIASVTAEANAGWLTITAPAAFAPWTGNRAIISGMNVKDFPGLNGKWAMYNVTTTSFKIRYNYHQTGTFLVKTGQFRPETYVYGTIDPNLSGFSHFRSRDTGRNPLGGRGRRTSSRIRSR